MIGRQLHQYLITAKLGEGGMGVVWRARDVRLDRDVAIKVLPATHLDHPVQRERFMREAKAASALNHPNIVTIYEIDSDAGVDFIAMEFVGGVTLAERLHQGPLEIGEAMRVATQVADALARAHTAHILHRDLKPGNIMIGEDGIAKVLDFGIAKVQAGGPAGAETDSEVFTVNGLTAEGTTLGTLAYMSPEQALGEVVDPRSDVFSFGVVLYEMLSGTTPFAADSRSDTLYKLHFAEAPDLRLIRPSVPAALIAIVARALAKKRELRYANMAEVRSALGQVQLSTVTSALAGPPVVPAPVQARRSRRVAYASVAALVTTLGVGGYVFRDWTAPAASPPRSEPDLPITGTAFELSSQAGILLKRQDRDGNTDRAIALLGTALKQDPSHAMAYVHLADAYRRKQRDNPDPQWVKLADESARRALELNPDLAAAQAIQGFLDLDAGRGDEAERRFRRAMELDPLSPHPHIGLALRLASDGRDLDARAEYDRAVALKEDDWRPDSELGLFLYRRGRFEQAAVAWEAARQVTPDNVLVLRNLGAAYHLLGRYDEAAASLQRALEIRPSAPTYTNLGTSRFFQGRYADAVAAFEKAVELGAPNYLFWGNLGDAYRWAPGRRDEAPAAYARAIDLLREQLASKPGDVELDSRLAVYLMKRGDRDEALQTIARVDLATNLPPQALMRVVVVHELAGNRAMAIDALERALKAGFPTREIANEPELVALRADARYHRLIGSFNRPPPKE